MKMEGSRTEEPNEEGIPVSLAGLGYGNDQIWVAGVTLTPSDCPSCLESDPAYDCGECTYFVPSDCPLRRQYYVANVRAVFDLYRQRRVVPKRGRRRLVQAVAAELRAHGRPLHYQIITRMVADRYPTLQVTASRVLKILNSKPEMFEKLRAGVYRNAKPES